MFFDDLNFAKLVAPIDFDDFFTHYFDRKTAVFTRKNSSFYAGLLSPDDLDQLLFYWPNEATVVKASDYQGMRQNLNGQLVQQSTPTVLNELDRGSTLILDKLDQRLSSITSMCAQFERELHFPFQANVYITPAQAQGFKPHFDDHHVFILQTTGTKRWRIDTEAKPRNTSADKALDFVVDPERHIEVSLQQGDMLYIPPYTVHEAVAQDTYSVHITMSPYPPSYADLLESLIKYSAELTPALQQPLHAGFLSDTANTLEGRASELFMQLAQANLAVNIGRFKSDNTDKFRGAYHGALRQRITTYSNAELEQARFQLNRDLFWLRHTHPDEIRIQCPHKRLAFPRCFETALDFCLSGIAFTLTDIPGMSTDEKQVLVRRLCAEALIQKTN